MERQIDDILNNVALAWIGCKLGLAADALDHAAKQMEVREGGRVANVQHAARLVFKEPGGVLEEGLFVVAAGGTGARVILEGVVAGCGGSRCRGKLELELKRDIFLAVPAAGLVGVAVGPGSA